MKVLIKEKAYLLGKSLVFIEKNYFFFSKMITTTLINVQFGLSK